MDKVTPLLCIYSYCVLKCFLVLKQNRIFRELKLVMWSMILFKLSQFADDTTLILDCSEHSLAAAIKTIQVH